MWRDEDQQQLEQDLEDLRRDRPERRITRAQRRLATPHQQREHLQDAERSETMAAAAPLSPEDNDTSILPERDVTLDNTNRTWGEAMEAIPPIPRGPVQT